jgi:hypothetical protein
MASPPVGVATETGHVVGGLPEGTVR